MSETRTAAGRLFVAYEDANDEGAGNSLGHLMGIRHWTIRDVVLAIESEAQRLTVERLTPWLIHGLDASGHQCGFYTAEPCDCGLRAALAREETGA